MNTPQTFRAFQIDRFLSAAVERICALKSNTARLPSLIAFAIGVTGCASSPPAAAPVQARSSAPAAEYLPIPSQFEAAVREAETAGRMLYERDRAAEKATDLLVSAGYLKQPPGRRAGWLTRDLGESRYHVSYLAEQNGAVRSFAEADYSIVTDRASDPLAMNPPRPLDPVELAQATAIRTAQSSEFLRCAEKYNVVATTDSADGSAIHVYLIPSRDEQNVFPMGGFHDITVSADGNAIAAHYSQTRACLNDKPELDGGRTLAALMSSHITTPAPTLFHVFMSLNYRMNVFAVTTQNRMLWSISGGRIRLVSNDVNKKQ